MTSDLPVIWAGLIAFSVLATWPDGFDLGVGILFRLRKGNDRDVMMNSVAPVWDAMKPGWCWAAVACWRYSRWPMPLMPALYAPLIACCWHSSSGRCLRISLAHQRGPVLWTGLSAAAPRCDIRPMHGPCSLVQGIPVVNRAYAGGCGIVLALHLAHGRGPGMGYACWGHLAVMKTEGELQKTSRKQALDPRCCHHCPHRAVSLWTHSGAPLLRPLVAWPAISSVPLCLCWFWSVSMAFTRAARKSDYRPFFSSLGLFILASWPWHHFYPLSFRLAFDLDAAAPTRASVSCSVGALFWCR